MHNYGLPHAGLLVSRNGAWRAHRRAQRSRLTDAGGAHGVFETHRPQRAGYRTVVSGAKGKDTLSIGCKGCQERGGLYCMPAGLQHLSNSLIDRRLHTLHTSSKLYVAPPGKRIYGHLSRS